MVDSHTIATFAFAQLERDPAFHRRYGWVRNTVVCVESDLADDVLRGQMVHFFPDGGTIACYYPREQRFMFIRVGATVDARSPEAQKTPPGAAVANDKYREITVGMLIDTMYPNRKDWGHPPQHGGEPMVDEVSTVEVEKQLTLR